MNSKSTTKLKPSTPDDAMRIIQWQQIRDRLDGIERLVSQLDEGQDETCAIPIDTVPLVSVVIPVYNERETILQVIEKVARQPFPKEIWVVDDCSTDGTRQELERIHGVDGLHVIYKPVNQGKGAALRSGFENVRGQFVIVQDADLEYDPQDMQAVLAPLLRGDAEAVFGSRFLHEVHQDKSALHRWGNWLLTEASNLFTGVRLTDMETCYKAFRADVLKDIQIKQNRFGVEPEITAKIVRRGYRVVEVPIGYQARSYQQGKKIGIRDLFKAFYCIVRYGIAD